MSEPQEFITRREFDAVTKYYDKALGDLGLANDRRAKSVEDELRRLANLIIEKAAVPAQAPPEMLSMAAALHRGVAALESQKGNSGGAIRWVALAIMAVATAYAGHLAVGHW